MAKTPFSLLLRRRYISQTHRPPLSLLLLLRSHVSSKLFFSTSQPSPSAPNSSDPKSSLSARMSFVFDQIDAIEKEQSEKDDALQRIRAWRQSKNQNPIAKDEHHPHRPVPELGVDNAAGNSNARDSDRSEVKESREGLVLGKEVELVHPWKEWVELMERLVQQNYFDHRRKDEDRMIQDSGFDVTDIPEEGLDFTRDFKAVQTACLNFGRDRFDILRSLSRQDIQLLVGYGCPSVEKKVVFSAKLLRKLVHLDEGDVCSSCSLRTSCERAYLVTNREDEARTFDVMRILLTFGFDPINGSVVNKSLLKMKSTKTVARKLLHEVVRLSAVPIDPNLSPPVIKKPPPKVKQPPPPPKKRIGRDDVEMKKGDWLCPKCDFMNFAKNTVCLQCDAKRPKRQLLPGEWECPQCNFLNYRRNMACFHCECKRPPDEYMENHKQERQQFPKMRLDRVANRQEVSNAWNFDFDDAESDGADVAAFEYADSPRIDEQLDGPTQGHNFREPENKFYKGIRSPRSQETQISSPDHKKSGAGFNDFDDEDDDVDNYEIDSQNSTPVRRDSFDELPEPRAYSESEDFDNSDDDLPARHRMSSTSSKQSKQKRVKALVSDSEEGFDVDTDEDLPVHSNWKSSRVADTGQINRGGPAGVRTRGMRFSSNEDLGFSSGSDGDLGGDVPSRQGGHDNWALNRKGFRGGSSDIEDERFYGSESDSDNDDVHSHGNRFRGNKTGPSRRGGFSNGWKSFDLSRQTHFSSDYKVGNRRPGDPFDRSGRANSHGKGRFSDKMGRDYDRDRSQGRGGRGNGRGNRRNNDRGQGFHDFDDYSPDRPQRYSRRRW